MGILAFGNVQSTFGGTVRACIVLFQSFYGVVVSMLLTFAIGPAHEVAYAFVLLVRFLSFVRCYDLFPKTYRRLYLYFDFAYKGVFVLCRFFRPCT